jgi:hypothetical protein
MLSCILEEEEEEEVPTRVVVFIERNHYTSLKWTPNFFYFQSLLPGYGSMVSM